jgi:Flp pilus assembly protein TadD
MFVTWPFVMLLLDYWPLNRLKWRPADGLNRLARSLAPLVREKIPIFVLAAASIAITYIAQSRGGAVRQFDDAPVSLRISNALVSYARYIVSLLWPSGLGVYYPFSPRGIPPWQVAASLALVAGITIVVIRAMKGRGYLITGWAWYLGTLIPVIGLVQVGGQAMADRYSYIPSVGLFVFVVWGVADLIGHRRLQYRAIALAAVIWLTILGSLAWVQAGYWRDSITLFRHTLLVAPDNLVVHYNLAHALGKQGNLNEAVAHFGEALRIKPDFFDALINIGVTLNDQRRFAEATTYLTRAVELEPASSKAHLQLAIALAQSGSSDEALRHFYLAMDAAPADSDVRTNLGLMLARQGKLPEAREQLNEALRLNPNSPEAHNNLGLVLLMQGEPDKSIPEFSTALRLKPEFKLAQDNLNRAQAQAKARRE